MGQEKQKKRGGEKVKILNPKILLFAHARTWQADILHLDQNASKGTTCKQLCGNF